MLKQPQQLFVHWYHLKAKSLSHPLLSSIQFKGVRHFCILFKEALSNIFVKRQPANLWSGCSRKPSWASVREKKQIANIWGKKVIKEKAP